MSFHLSAIVKICKSSLHATMFLEYCLLFIACELRTANSFRNEFATMLFYYFFSECSHFSENSREIDYYGLPLIVYLFIYLSKISRFLNVAKSNQDIL
jgi:hypothetical protein